VPSLGALKAASDSPFLVTFISTPDPWAVAVSPPACLVELPDGVDDVESSGVEPQEAKKRIAITINLFMTLSPAAQLPIKRDLGGNALVHKRGYWT
jgi:hypothetical protein